MNDTQLVEELRKLRVSVESLRLSIDTATSAGTNLADSPSDLRDRGEEIAATLEQLQSLHEDGVISGDDYETNKQKLLSRFVVV
ncbi:SHOCT domain-containing protein [Kribbella solani]|uniref:SHOCT domain-containing protein n=1 Tax=Kribbella solani TaxID=236067 RepID=A0A841DWX4_9ACTN|nr:SHOCT domain-containing protein [Kribbella solani]MBB5983083.1 hypothetical protein [Kribbella solani]MDX2973862.1 SHOCT domain-containing protein [Kribbella solani]MDX3000636.1 SHOCT domain-containing protein [Kribbella solani]